MASKFIPGGFTPLAKSKGNNSKPMNGRGKFTRVVLRQRRVFETETGEIKQHMIFHKLRGRTDAEVMNVLQSAVKGY